MGVAASTAVPGGSRGRPGYWFLLRGVLVGQIVGTVCLWLIAMAFALAVRWHTDGRSLFVPWQVDSAWSLAAVIGWGVLVSATIGSAVRDRVRVRVGVTPSRLLTFASVGAAGYAPWLVTATPGARLVLTVLATPALLLVLAFDHSGQARRLPRRAELTRAGLGVVLAGALILVAPYAVVHLTAHPSEPALVVFNGLDTSPVYGTGEASLTAGRDPITVTAVRVIETDAARVAVRIGAPPFSSDRPLVLPMTIEPRHTVWLGYHAAIKPCTVLPDGIRFQVKYATRGKARTATSSAAYGDTSGVCP
jgi:uncharacterized membrane protein